MADENKWNFEDDTERSGAIQAEAECRAREAEAAPNAEAQAAVAEAAAKARIAEADANARGREAEAKYAWVDGANRLVRMAVLGAALFASFYYTPDFWPLVARTVSEVIHIALTTATR